MLKVQQFKHMPATRLQHKIVNTFQSELSLSTHVKLLLKAATEQACT